jgi:5-methylcytosine-specific restriction enzyme A
VKLTMLKPRLSNLDSRRVAQVPATERIRGNSLRKIRERILRRDCGICQCEVCRKADCPLPASEVDHTVPLWASGAESDDNRLSLAATCHEAKTTCEAAMRAAGGWLATPCTCGRHGTAA